MPSAPASTSPLARRRPCRCPVSGDTRQEIARGPLTWRSSRGRRELRRDLPPEEKISGCGDDASTITRLAGRMPPCAAGRSADLSSASDSAFASPGSFRRKVGPSRRRGPDGLELVGDQLRQNPSRCASESCAAPKPHDCRTCVPDSRFSALRPPGQWELAAITGGRTEQRSIMLSRPAKSMLPHGRPSRSMARNKSADIHGRYVRRGAEHHEPAAGRRRARTRSAADRVETRENPGLVRRQGRARSRPVRFAVQARRPGLPPDTARRWFGRRGLTVMAAPAATARR